MSETNAPDEEREMSAQPNAPEEVCVKTAHPNGHFYSPIVEPARSMSRAWPVEPKIIGIEFDDSSHERILRDVFPRHMPAYDYPEHLEEGSPAHEFYTRNSQYSWLDSRVLFVLLNEWRPQRMIEVGSGFSTLLAADVNRRFLGGNVEIICVEPYPREFLKQGVPGVARLVEPKVQEVPLAEFSRLQVSCSSTHHMSPRRAAM